MNINIGIENATLLRQLGCGFIMLCILGGYLVVVSWLSHHLNHNHAGHILVRFIAYLLGIGAGYFMQPIVTNGLFQIEGDNARTAAFFGCIAVTIWIANRTVPDFVTGGTSTKDTGK